MTFRIVGDLRRLLGDIEKGDRSASREVARVVADAIANGEPIPKQALPWLEELMWELSFDEDPEKAFYPNQPRNRAKGSTVGLDTQREAVGLMGLLLQEHLLLRQMQSSAYRLTDVFFKRDRTGEIEQKYPRKSKAKAASQVVDYLQLPVSPDTVVRWFNKARPNSRNKVGT